MSYDASAITVLEGLDAVRKRPGMYIGSTGERGLHHLVTEVVDNAVDEALAGYCDTINVTLLPDGAVRVEDNGRGIPVDIVESEGKPAVEVVLTVLHAGGKFGGSGYAVSGGLHGVGVSVVNALSTHLDVEVRREGHVYRQTYVYGVPEAPIEKGEATSDTGTIVTFWADGDIFETTTYDFSTLSRRFQEMAFLNKGLTLNLCRSARRRGDRRRRRGRGRAARDHLPLRGRHRGLREVPQHDEGTRAPARHPRRERGPGAHDLRRGRAAVELGLLRVGLHLRQHDQHHGGRHARGGLPRRAHHTGEQVRA